MDKQTYRIKSYVFSSGERVPLLLGPDVQPMFYPTLFITTRARGPGQSFNSIISYLGAIKRLYIWAANRGFHIESRLADGLYLHDSELEALANVLGERLPAKRLPARARVVPLRSPRKHPDRVLAATKYRHLMFVVKYLEWLANQLLRASDPKNHTNRRSEISLMCAALEARKPRRKKGKQRRQGLSVEDHVKFLNSLAETASDYPQAPGLDIRDRLIGELLSELGIRSGELLSLKTSDFDFQRNEVVVERRPDDPEDPRVHQPLVKTEGRRLPLSEQLAKLVFEYILGPRRDFKRARRHKFLIVVHRAGLRQGDPLSLKSLSKVFVKLSARSGLVGLTPHVMRHSANERFSEHMDEQRIPESREEKMRSYSMGWKEGTGSAAIYTRRHTERAAREAQKKLQEKMHGLRKK